MALGKKTTPKKAAPAAKTPKSPVKVLSDQEKVLSEYKTAVCVEIKTGFVIFDDDRGSAAPVHSGIAKSELDAWKLAAHNL